MRQFCLLLLVGVLFSFVGCEEVVFEGVDDGVLMFLELAQGHAEEESHEEVAPCHLLEAVVKNSRILNSLRAADGFDLDEFLSATLRQFPRKPEDSTETPSFSSASIAVVEKAKDLAKEENMKEAKPFHLYEALFLCDEIVQPLKEKLFETQVIDNSLALMKRAKKNRSVRNTGECTEEDKEKEQEKEKPKEVKESQSEYVEETYPDWLKKKIGDGSGWSMFLNLAESYRPTISPSVIEFGFDVLELFPENSIVIVTGQPLYQIFLELPNVVRKELVDITTAQNELTEENSAGVRGVRSDVYPIYTGYLKEEMPVSEKKEIYFPKLTFPAQFYSSEEEKKENTYNLLDFINANYEDHHIFLATDPILDKGGVWDDLGWQSDYFLIPHGFGLKVIKHTDVLTDEWFKPHIEAVFEMTKKISIKKQTDNAIKSAFWNLIRLLHQKIFEVENGEHIDAKQKFLTMFLRKVVLKQQDELEFVPLDVLYLYCLNYMKWVYPEIGSEILPDRERFAKHRPVIDEVLERYQNHPDFEEGDVLEKDTMKSFGEYLALTEKAIEEWEAGYEKIMDEL